MTIIQVKGIIILLIKVPVKASHFTMHFTQCAIWSGARISVNWPAFQMRTLSKTQHETPETTKNKESVSRKGLSFMKDANKAQIYALTCQVPDLYSQLVSFLLPSRPQPNTANHTQTPQSLCSRHQAGPQPQHQVAQSYPWSSLIHTQYCHDSHCNLATGHTKYVKHQTTRCLWTTPQQHHMG